MVDIDNEDPALSETGVKILQDKQRQVLSSSVKITLAEIFPYNLASLK